MNSKQQKELKRIQEELKELLVKDGEGAFIMIVTDGEGSNLSVNGDKTNVEALILSLLLDERLHNGIVVSIGAAFSFASQKINEI